VPAGVLLEERWVDGLGLVVDRRVLGRIIFGRIVPARLWNMTGGHDVSDGFGKEFLFFLKP
jgi:hypothetical protein